MNEKIFRHTFVDSSSVAAGTIMELNLPYKNKFRWLWCFFQNDSFTVGSEAWMRFYFKGEIVVELPAEIQPRSGIQIKMSNSYITHLSSNTTGAAVIFFNNSDNSGYYCIHPFKLVAECDRVTLETNTSGLTRALLAVLSTDLAF